MTQPDEIHSEFERRLHEQYREAAKEMPPSSLDKRILDAARAAAAEGSARGNHSVGDMAANDFPVNDVPFHADRDDAPRTRREEFRWGKPLALAATVVLGIGIAVRVQMERPDMGTAGDKVVTAEAPTAPPPPAAAAPPAAAHGGTAPPAR